MSVVLRHAILITASYDDPNGWHWINVAHAAACEIFQSERQRQLEAPLGYVTEPTEHWLNNVRSFAVLPSGSDENHDPADEEEAAREEFLAWLRDQSYGINEDGEYEGSPLSWVALSYGGDQYVEPLIEADSGELGRVI